MGNKRHVAFLLGSGVSIPAGAPGTVDITQMVLDSKRRITRNSVEIYKHASEDDLIPNHVVDRIVQLRAVLKWLEHRINQYYDGRSDPAAGSSRSCNYEDLFFLSAGIRDTLSGERDDPGLLPLAERAACALCVSCDELSEIAREACNYIHDTVTEELNKACAPAGHLGALVDAARGQGVKRVDVFTLNHDCLIEQAFRSRGLELYDGMQRSGDGRHVLRLSTLSASDVRCTLLKLHGSLKWFRWRSNTAGSDAWEEWLGHLSEDGGAGGGEWEVIDERPLLLIGRFNKEERYTGPIFGPLFWEFRRRLQDHESLVVSGYSFGDKAINSILIDWIYGADKGKRKIVVAHENEAELRSNARGAVSNAWDSWKNSGNLVVRSSFLCNLSWDDIRSHLR